MYFRKCLGRCCGNIILYVRNEIATFKVTKHTNLQTCLQTTNLQTNQVITENYTFYTLLLRIWNFSLTLTKNLKFFTNSDKKFKIFRYEFPSFSHRYLLIKRSSQDLWRDMSQQAYKWTNIHLCVKWNKRKRSIVWKNIQLFFEHFPFVALV